MSIFADHKIHVTIEEALPEDALGITTVQKVTWIDTYPNEQYGITTQDILSKNFDDPKRMERWRKVIEENGDEKVWVAKEENGLIGFCSAMREQVHNRIRAVYVKPEFQHMGIGSMLMQKACFWLGREKDVMLSVATYNRNAITFYEKLGFQQQGEVIPRSLPSGKFIPEIEMRKPGATLTPPP
jgi:ribosomal protein S18 acetylase RimI-like enzyme